MYEKCFKDGSLRCCPMSPIDFFIPRNGLIVREESGNYGITIFMKPFFWDNENVITEVRLDSVNLNNIDFEALSCKNFTFPVNPEDGYINGSVYIESRHNHIDVLSISFGSRLNDLIESSADTDYIAVTVIYNFCWEGYEKLLYPELRRFNTVLEYREVDYKKIQKAKDDRIQKKLLLSRDKKIM